MYMAKIMTGSVKVSWSIDGVEFTDLHLPAAAIQRVIHDMDEEVRKLHCEMMGIPYEELPFVFQPTGEVIDVTCYDSPKPTFLLTEGSNEKSDKRAGQDGTGGESQEPGSGSETGSEAGTGTYWPSGVSSGWAAAPLGSLADPQFLSTRYQRSVYLRQSPMGKNRSYRSE